jgi:hypothetical protein
MRRSIKVSLAAAFLLAAFLPAQARASFGFENLDVTFSDAEDGTVAMQAGSHPFAMKTTIDFNVDPGTGQPEGSPKNLVVDLPAGLVANPTAVPRCSTADFLTLHDVSKEVEQVPSCPDGTAIGFIGARSPGEAVPVDFGAVYNLPPPPGAAFKFGFRVLTSFVTGTASVRSEGEDNAFATLENIQQIEPVAGAELTLWGNPASPAHNAKRGPCLITLAADSCPANLTVAPFLTLPRSCRGPLLTRFEMTSWQEPAAPPAKAATLTHDESEPPEPLGTLGCSALGFAPRIASQPTTDRAESPSGLDFNLDINDEGLTNPEGIAQSDIKKAVVTLPEGVTINPSIAEGLATCSEADLAREAIDSEPGEGCPQASKVGTVEVETPLLEGELLKGQLFVATQDANPFHSMIALYMVIKDPKLGIMVKLPGKVEPDPKTGQLITTFGEPGHEVPQFPFSHFRFHFREGGRSPLITPPHCGTYTTQALFTPWANPENPLATTATFQITRGVDGGPCPSGGVPPFKPGFEAGSINNSAGSYSPFFMRLTRQDGEQDMTKFSAILPPGLVGKLAGISKCPEAQIAAARAKTGREELAAPSCPANSKIGRTLAGAGVGSQLTYVPGSLYLAGPIGGDPLSVVAVTPAVAGPFDAGTVVVRVALTLNPVTAEVEADGSHSEPIPHILKGIVLKLRDLRVYADRPSFTINPTSCAPSSTRSTLFGSFLDVFSSADDVPVSLSARYQAADCANLAFKPKLSFRLKGGTRRGSHPAFTAIVTPRPGDANFAKAIVTLPRSAFLDQGHIRTICTRVQFAASACPAASIYGQATVQTPLLDEPLSGPVYLRSSNHNLPDLVVALHGIVDITVSSRIDSHKGGIRNSFEAIPDAPFSRFELALPGGQKGLIVNSRNLCAHSSRATVLFSGQNGKEDDFNPPVKASGCSKSSSR